MSVRLLRIALPHTQGILIHHAISFVPEPDCKVVDAKTVCPGSVVNIRTQCLVKGAQGGIVQVAKEIPEQADIQLRTGWECQQIIELLTYFLRTRHVLQVTNQWFRKQIQKVDPALVAGKEFDCFR